MSLSRRITLILLTIIAIYITLNYLIQKHYILPSYSRIEHAIAQKDLNRCIDAIFSEINRLKAHTHEWGKRDAIYNFIKKRDQQFITSNLQTDTFIDSRLNLILFYDTSRKLIWGKYVENNKSSTKKLEYFDKLLEVYLPEKLNFANASTDTHPSGIIISKFGPVLLATNPILKSTGKGPCRGTLIMGRLLNNNYIDHLRKRTHVDFKVTPISDIKNTSKLKNIINKITPEQPLYFNISKNNYLHIYTLFNDIHGTPSLLIQAETEREVYVQGQKTLTYSLHAILIIGVILLAIMIVIIQTTVIRPISNLTNHAIMVKKSHNLTSRIYEKRKDEIGILSRELDNMLIEINEINNNLENRIIERTNEIMETRKNSIFRLASAAEERDTDTGLHLKRIQAITTLLAEKSGIEENKAKMIGLASILHDIGKIGIQDDVLFKKDKFTEKEYEIMKKHTFIGGKILGGNDTELIETACQIALYHHERWSGGGYPSGLSGEKIPLPARITAIADVFDALASKRVYKHAWSMTEIKIFFEKNQGKQLDPTLTNIFLENFSEFVKLRSKFQEKHDNC